MKFLSILLILLAGMTDRFTPIPAAQMLESSLF